MTAREEATGPVKTSQSQHEGQEVWGWVAANRREIAMQPTRADAGSSARPSGVKVQGAPDWFAGVTRTEGTAGTAWCRV